MRAATIYDVARVAGVSHQTVSRYLAGFEGIRAETRARVEAALTELDYRPNAAARLLRTRRTNRIGVLAYRVDQTGPARLIAGATRAAHRRGYLLDVVVTDELDVAAIDEALAVVTEHQVAGILATAQTEEVVKHLARVAQGVPFVVDSRLHEFAGGATMNAAAARLAADHLLDLGHRSIGYVSGPLAWIAASERLEAFRDRVQERGGDLVWTREGDWSASSGHAAWRTLDRSEREVSAIATGNDSTALGLISAATSDGFAVPERLSVIGNDDFQEARYVLPALTTIALDFEGEGRLLVERLIAGVERDESPIEPPAPPRLVVRASTRPRDTTR